MPTLTPFLCLSGDVKSAAIYVPERARREYAPSAKLKKTALRNSFKSYLPFIIGIGIIKVWKLRAFHAVIPILNGVSGFAASLEKVLISLVFYGSLTK